MPQPAALFWATGDHLLSKQPNCASACGTISQRHFSGQNIRKDAEIFRREFAFRQPLYPLELDRKPSTSTFESGISLKPANLILSALKKAEDDESLILRFFETKGERCQAALTLPSEITFVQPINLLEEEDEPSLDIEENKVLMEVSPFEIVTLKLRIQ